MKKIVLILFSFFSFLFASAQTGTDQPEMADALYANGKIYVVIVVGMIILTGIFIYLIMLDRRVGRMEKNSK